MVVVVAWLTLLFENSRLGSLSPKPEVVRLSSFLVWGDKAWAFGECGL